MSHRRRHSDTISPTIHRNSTPSTPTPNHAQSISSLPSSAIGRVNIPPIRGKLMLNNMTRMMVKLTPDTQPPKVLNRSHEEIPTIPVNNHLTYCLYITIQNLIHLNVIYILFYHTIFWLNPATSNNEIVHFIEKLENTEYEQTLFVVIQNNGDDIFRPRINVHLINKYVYITLIIVSTIELVSTFLWTIHQKLSSLTQRSPKCRNRLRSILIGMIISLYLTFIVWLFFHTFITHYLTLTIFIAVLVHLTLLILLDKPNLFRDIPIYFCKRWFSTWNLTHKHRRHSPSWLSMSSPMASNPTSRLPYRSAIPIQSRKVNSLFSSTRWVSIAEQNLDIHECSTLYADIRQEANHLWSMVVRRIALKFYRTFASFIFFDLIPYKMTDAKIPSTDNQRYKLLIIIFALSTFLTHNVFLFSNKFQVNLHRLSTHLGRWRSKSCNGTDKIPEWSSECNSYTCGNMIKLSSNTVKHFIAIQGLSTAAHPQSISHSILYRLFGDLTSFLIIRFLLCFILIFCQLFWIIRGKFGFEALISILITFNSSYTIFQIIRDRVIFDLMDIHESEQDLFPSKQKKIKLNK